MARVPLNLGNKIDLTKTQGEELEGEFQGRDEVPSKLSPTGKQNLWTFLGEDGRKFGIYGFTMLDLAMENAVPGDYLYIRYLGTKNQKTKWGMKDVHQVSVEKEVLDEGADPHGAHTHAAPPVNNTAPSVNTTPPPVNTTPAQVNNTAPSVNTPPMEPAAAKKAALDKITEIMQKAFPFMATNDEQKEKAKQVLTAVFGTAKWSDIKERSLEEVRAAIPKLNAQCAQYLPPGVNPDDLPF